MNNALGQCCSSSPGFVLPSKASIPGPTMRMVESKHCPLIFQLLARERKLARDPEMTLPPPPLQHVPGICHFKTRPGLRHWPRAALPARRARAQRVRPEINTSASCSKLGTTTTTTTTPKTQPTNPSNCRQSVSWHRRTRTRLLRDAHAREALSRPPRAPAPTTTPIPTPAYRAEEGSPPLSAPGRPWPECLLRPEPSGPLRRAWLPRRRPPRRAA